MKKKSNRRVSVKEKKSAARKANHENGGRRTRFPRGGRGSAAAWLSGARGPPRRWSAGSPNQPALKRGTGMPAWAPRFPPSGAAAAMWKVPIPHPRPREMAPGGRGRGRRGTDRPAPAPPPPRDRPLLPERPDLMSRPLCPGAGGRRAADLHRGAAAAPCPRAKNSLISDPLPPSRTQSPQPDFPQPSEMREISAVGREPDSSWRRSEHLPPLEKQPRGEKTLRTARRRRRDCR